MTVLNGETNIEQPLQEKSDTILSQDKVDTNLTQQKVENPQQNPTEDKEDEANKDPNWRAFRAIRKKERAEKEAAERKAFEKEQEIAALKAAMEAAFSKGAPSPQAYQQYYGMNQGFQQQEETDEQRIERIVQEKISKKEEEYRRQQLEYEQREYPTRLKRDFPDFAQVCSQENLDYLDFHYPEISRPLQRLAEGYDKWYDTYYAVKKLIPNHSTAKKEALRAEINSNKPRSMSSAVSSPPGERIRESWQETEARRAERWAKMQQTLKGIG